MTAVLATAVWLSAFFVVTFGSLLLVGWISDRQGWD